MARPFPVVLKERSGDTVYPTAGRRTAEKKGRKLRVEDRQEGRDTPVETVHRRYRPRRRRLGIRVLNR